MKNYPEFILPIVTLLIFVFGSTSLRAQSDFGGLWNFDEADLTATAGEDLEYMDEDTMADLVEFGTTEALGLPAINDEVANVVRIQKLDPDQGLVTELPSDSNGGGDTINIWTGIMDILIPATAVGKKQSLIEIVTDDWVAGAADAEIYIGTQNGIGTSGLEFGTLTPETWYCVAIVVNMEELWGRIYIDGKKVGEVAAPDGSLDGRWSLDTLVENMVTFFNDDNNESEEIFVNSIQLRFEALNDGQLMALGGAAASGIPEELPPVPSFIESWTPDDKYAKANTSLSVVLNAGDTTIGNDTISLELNGKALERTVETTENIITITATGGEALQTASEYELTLTYTDSAKGEQTESVQFEVPVYYENFDNVELGANVDEQAVQSEAAWTA